MRTTPTTIVPEPTVLTSSMDARQSESKIFSIGVVFLLEAFIHFKAVIQSLTRFYAHQRELIDIRYIYHLNIFLKRCSAYPLDFL